jgi:hypothetical protein
MTKSQEKGENEFTRYAKREALRTNRSVCDILQELMDEAEANRDAARIRKIRKAQKYLECRDRRRRRRRR